MQFDITFLGGVGEMGANSCYLHIDGTGIVIDAGIHPKKRNHEAFPAYELIKDKPVDLLLLTHAHTDHIGALPYLLKYHPQIAIYSTLATRDLSELMLRDTAKLLKTEIGSEFPMDSLSLYKKEVLEKIHLIIKGFKYDEEIEYMGNRGQTPVKISFRYSGHILGSASIMIEAGGKSFLHTSDIKFENQAVIKGAILPKHHFDILVTESTNAGDKNLPEYKDEKNSLSKFINEIVNENGSILIPAFALGKHQEILKILYSMMKSGKIPSLPIYTIGMGNRISRLYDVYCYTTPRMEPGFEMTDIPQMPMSYDELMKGQYFREPSIVVAPSGMLNKGTASFKLALRWVSFKNFGIAFIGYLDEDSPGRTLINSSANEYFNLSGIKVKRICRIGKFRFTSHANLDGLLNNIEELKPGRLFIVHGDDDSAENLAILSSEILPQTNITLPVIGKNYEC